MNSENETTATPQPSRVPRSALQLMALILVAMSLLAIYSNVQKARLAQIEQVTIIAPTPQSSPAVSPSPAAP